MRRFTVIAVVVALAACTALAGCSGGGSSVADLGAVRAKLTDAGYSCPKPPQAYEHDKDDISLGVADPTTEVHCTVDGVKLTGSQWKNADAMKAALSVAMTFVCGFGMSEITSVEGDTWALDADSSDTDSAGDTTKEDAALAKAAKALGMEPKTHKCDKSSKSKDDASMFSDDDSDAADTTAPTTTVASRGSRAEPLAVGETAQLDDYDVTVDAITPDATAQVQGANEFNDPPKKGQYAEVTLTAVYTGDDEGTPRMDLSVVLSGSDKVQYKDSDCEASIGDSDYNTLEPGGKAQFTVCIDAPAAAITGGLVFVESTYSLGNDDRAFWKMA